MAPSSDISITYDVLRTYVVGSSSATILVDRMVGQLELKQRGESYFRILVQRRLRSPSRLFLLLHGYKIPSFPHYVVLFFSSITIQPFSHIPPFIYTYSQWLGAGVSSTSL